MPSRKAPSSPPDQDQLAQFLDDPANRRLSTAEYVAQGVERVTDHHVEQLMPRLEPLSARIAQINGSPRLQQRLDHFVRFIAETAEEAAVHATARREIAFALAYFFHGADRIPDGTPEYGLLDDALVVESVMLRNQAALRAHAERMGRPLAEEL